MKMIERIMVSAIIADQLVEYENIKVWPVYRLPEASSWTEDLREDDGSLPECVKERAKDAILGVTVRLHGNTIARINKSEKEIRLDCCHWYTNTTRSRLNAILLSLTGGAFTVDRYFDLVQSKESDWKVTLKK